MENAEMSAPSSCLDYAVAPWQCHLTGARSVALAAVWSRIYLGTPAEDAKCSFPSLM